MKKQEQKSFQDLLTPEGRENFDKILGYATALLMISQAEDVQQIAAAYRAVFGGALKGLLLEPATSSQSLTLRRSKKWRPPASGRKTQWLCSVPASFTRFSQLWGKTSRSAPKHTVKYLNQKKNEMRNRPAGRSPECGGSGLMSSHEE